MPVSRPRPLVAGNWKMNGLRRHARVLGEITEGYGPELRAKVDLLVCPPTTLVYTFAVVALGSRVAVGGQDCHAEEAGAFTGDVSAAMLADLGATHVILGHSERRQHHRETDAQVRAKAEAAWRAGLTAIVCVGETRAERERGETLDIVRCQVAGSVPEGARADRLIVAYEPVWAIGSGRTPTPDDVAEVHGGLRAELSSRMGGAEAAATRLLYGGSVKPENARELLGVDDVDGALVGGASLKAADFLAIAGAYLP